MSLVNIVEFATPSGNKSVELHHSDLVALDKQVDALIVSAFPGDYCATPSSLIGALSEDFGISVEDLSKNPLLDARKQQGCWVSEELKDKPFKYIVCVEQFSYVDSAKAADTGFRDLFAFIAMLPYYEVELSSIAMPTLGTGDRGLPEDTVIPSAMHYVKRALISTTELRKVYFVERSEEKVEKLSEGFKEYLKNEDFDMSYVKSGGVDSEILKELRSSLQTLQNTHAQFAEEENCEKIKECIDNNSLSIAEFGWYSRRFIEVAVDALMGKDTKGNLYLSFRSF